MDELIAIAAPPCHECEQPIQRVEQAWDLGEDDNWHLRAFTVCSNGHRVRVEPLDD